MMDKDMQKDKKWVANAAELGGIELGEVEELESPTQVASPALSSFAFSAKLDSNRTNSSTSTTAALAKQITRRREELEKERKARLVLEQSGCLRPSFQSHFSRPERPSLTVSKRDFLSCLRFLQIISMLSSFTNSEYSFSNGHLRALVTVFLRFTALMRLKTSSDGLTAGTFTHFSSVQSPSESSVLLLSFSLSNSLSSSLSLLCELLPVSLSPCNTSTHSPRLLPKSLSSSLPMIMVFEFLNNA
uniref:Uncharacterized protein n=1 Tax=Glossina austeni TaxID=7395 RepID=A0A1A9V6H2_GLOAU